MIRVRHILCLTICFSLRMAEASPTDNYRFRTNIEYETVVGSGGETTLGQLHDLVFSKGGTMYGVAKQNGLVVFDATKKHWRLVDGDKPAIHGNIKVGLRALPLKSSGSRKLLVLDPVRLDRMTGYAEQIAVDPDGRLWVVTHDYTIYRQDGEFWQRMPGLAKSIEIGSDGTVFAMQAEPVRP